MKILIVDDEKPARDRLRQILDDEVDYDVVGEASNGKEALFLCVELRPDVILLDIRMPGLDGLETAQHLNTLEYAPAVVFTTAYDEYAVDAFDARAVGYVLKPVRRAKLTAALKNASRLTMRTLADVASQSKLDIKRRHVCVSAHGGIKLIPVESIVCFHADQKYVTVDHDEGQDLIDESLKSLADEFHGDFVRIHRGTLIAVQRIDRIEKTVDGKNRIVLRGDSQVDDQELIISRRHVADVRRRLKGA